MTKAELDYYSHYIPSIAKSLDKISKALDTNKCSSIDELHHVSEEKEQMLYVSEDDFNLIKTGMKHSVVRKGIRDVHLGNLVLYVSGEKDESHKVAVSADRIFLESFGAFTVEEAKNEGYKNLEQMKSAIKTMYPQITDDDIFTFIHFI